MKKILSLIFVTLLIATGCQSENTGVTIPTSATVKESTQTVEIEETTQNIAIEETTEGNESSNSQALADNVIGTEQVTALQSNNPQIKYNLTDEDMEIVRAIYDQRYKWETKHDEGTEEYTSQNFNVYYLNMFYDGEKIMFVPFYIYASGSSNNMRAHQLATAYYLDSSNELIELPDYYVDDEGYYTDSSVVQNGYVARLLTDEEKLESVAELYFLYKTTIE